MTPTILDEITQAKRSEVSNAKQRCTTAEMRKRADAMSPPRDFLQALAAPGPIKLIAEVKKASPSAGVIRATFNPAAIAQIYQDHGATCLSVLTDHPFFQGSITHLREVRATVHLPILRKDFIIDEYQILEARAAGADAILLIAEILSDQELVQFQKQAAELGMAALVEFHEKGNLSRVVDSGAPLIGINNRNLKTFTTSLEHTLTLRDRIPTDRLLVSESGIQTPEDVNRLAVAGVAAILVGETLMRAADPGRAIAALLGHKHPA